jgi:hypothetical protein
MLAGILLEQGSISERARWARPGKKRRPHAYTYH